MCVEEHVAPKTAARAFSACKGLFATITVSFTGDEIYYTNTNFTTQFYYHTVLLHKYELHCISLLHKCVVIFVWAAARARRTEIRCGEQGPFRHHHGSP